MITFLTIAGLVLAYFLVGAIYARTQVTRIYKRVAKNNEHWHNESYRQHWTRTEMFGALAPRIAFWPVASVYDLCAGPGARWFMRPVTKRQERAAKLRDDAKWQEEFAKAQTDPEVRAVIRDYAKMLRDQAKEVDLR